MRNFLKPILAVSLLYITFSSCRKQEFTMNVGDSIEVAADTIWFDTVFTKHNQSTPISVNKQFLIHNKNDKSIKTNIVLAGGATSHYRLNVDGVAGHSFSEVEIFPNDSLFLFVEIHPDPNNNSPDFNPLIIRDSILFETNGNDDKVNLIGWGQDAKYIFRDSIEMDTTWADTTLPVVIYGYCYVKPNVTLNIEKGMKIHFAPQSWLFVEGTVNINGTKEEQVIMQGDRLQPDWEEEAGQWGGIWISHPSHGNTIEQALIKNGSVGVYCDSTSGDPSNPNVTIKKSMIRNMLYDGVAGKYSHIVMENSVSTNCGRFTFLASFGGEYLLLNNTFYTGRRDFSRQDPTFLYTNIERDPFGGFIASYPIKFTFINNIIYGSAIDGEIGGDLDPSKVDIVNSAIDYNLLYSEDASYFGTGFSNIKLDDTLIDSVAIDAYNYMFDLKESSPAVNKGLGISSITDDNCNRPRTNVYDIGAYESPY